MPSTDKYTFDASILIAFSVESYPKDVFPTFWSNLKTLVEAGRVKIIEYVWKEVKWNSWIPYKDFESQACVYMGQLTPEEAEKIQEIVADILSATPSILKTKQNQIKSGWDLWLIAHAKMHGLTIVTGEKNGSGKIPEICKQLWVKCINMIDFLREIWWRI